MYGLLSPSPGRRTRPVSPNTRGLLLELSCPDANYSPGHARATSHAPPNPRAAPLPPPPLLVGASAHLDEWAINRKRRRIVPSFTITGIGYTHHPNSDVIWIDLADDRWWAIKVDAAGWGVVDNPPVRFCQPVGKYHYRRHGLPKTAHSVCLVFGFEIED